MVLETIALILFMSVIGGPLLGLILGTLLTVPALIFDLEPSDNMWMLTVVLAAAVTYVLGKLALDLSTAASVVAAAVILVTAMPGARRTDDVW